MNDDGMEWYKVGAGITWVLIFAGTWIYCIAAYGFLLGVALGWIAAAITATILCWLWPLYLIGVLIVGFLILKAQ